MLDPWIIEEIRRREEREREAERPRLELPLHMPRESHADTPTQKEERGVSIIDFSIG
jgi:hypothetical protein